MSSTGDHGNSKNLDHHRPDGGQDEGDGREAKRPMLETGQAGPSQGRVLVPETQFTDTQGGSTQEKPSSESSLFRMLRTQAGQGKWVHNKELGYHGTQERLRTLYQQDDDMKSVDGKADSEAEEGAVEESQQTAPGFTVVEHMRARRIAVRIAFSDLNGDSHQEKLEDLMALLEGHRINPPRTPNKVRIDGKNYFRVQTTTQDELKYLLDGEVDDTLHKQDKNEGDDEQLEEGTEEAVLKVRPLFVQIYDAEERKYDMTRSIELHGLPARVDLRLIRLAANQAGPVERITLSACARGIKMNATVMFEEPKAVELLQENNTRHLAIGQDLVRIKRQGETTVPWDLQYACKLHGLPWNTTPLDLFDTLQELEVNTDFVEVPRYYLKNGSQERYRKEAYVYFRTEEDMTKAMEMPIQMGYAKLQWLLPKEKRCYTCNEPLHEKNQCPVREKRRDEREHQKKVMQFHAATKSRVTSGTSFADLFREKGKEQRGQKQQGQATERQEGKTVHEKRVKEEKKVENGNLNQRQPMQALFGDGLHFPPLTSTQQFKTAPATSGTVQETQHANIFEDIVAKITERQGALEAALEKTQNDMAKAMVKLMDAQHDLAMKMQTIFETMQNWMMRVGVMGTTETSAQGAALASQMSLLSSQRSDTPLIDNRTTKKVKAELGPSNYDVAHNPSLPPTNVSRAGIEAAISSNQTSRSAGTTPGSGIRRAGPSSNTRAATSRKYF
ncbi:hypothetical protein BGZ99_004687 [Dissophora globulifera]|uniref:CCHC-type domain-containing protein n=1 Tax=Dissophora globulifera TaxID=979702 RepID=A0A9P6RJ02_9FUNG|nr:hypothetical protein BGZ99_004687 [Dissophora globulifera]